MTEAAGAGPALPKATEVVVIGGGVAGVSAAWYLQRAGVSFVLCEKGRIAGEQSSRNWGWIRKQGRDPRELALMCLAERLWVEIAAEVEVDIGFRRVGVAYVIESDADGERYERWLEHARLFQLDSRLLSARETDAMLPGNRLSHRGCLVTPSDHRAEPRLAVPAMAAALRRAGGVLAERCAVRGIDVEAGRVAGVVTERGRVACKAVIVAGGAWSALLLRALRVNLPQLTVLASAQRTTVVPNFCDSAVGTRKVAMRRRADGGYTLARTGHSRHRIGLDSFRHARAFLPVIKNQWRDIKFRLDPELVRGLAVGSPPLDRPGPFERTRVLDPSPDDALLDRILVDAKRAFPQLAEARPAERWAGAIDVLPDEVPVVGTVGVPAGVVVATGFCGHGFGIGPGAGYVAAQLVRGEAPAVDISGLALERPSIAG